MKAWSLGMAICLAWFPCSALHGQETVVRSVLGGRSFEGLEGPLLELDDVDGDGIGDVAFVVGSSSHNKEVVLWSPGTLREIRRISQPTGTRWVRSIPDSNSDGLRDIAVMVHGSPPLLILFDSNSGSEIVRLMLSGFWSPAMTPLGDVDGDMICDFMITDGSLRPPSQTSGQAWNAYSTATGAVLYQGGPGGSARGDVSADFDGDGILDPVITGGSSALIYSGSTGSFIGSFTDSRINGAESVAAGRDLNGDAVPDLAIGSQDQIFVVDGASLLLLGVLDPPMYQGVPVSGGRFDTGVILTEDVTGDGLADVASWDPAFDIQSSVTGVEGRLSCFRGTDLANVANVIGRTSNSSAPLVAGVGDVTGDGRAEVLTITRDLLNRPVASLRTPGGPSPAAFSASAGIGCSSAGWSTILTSTRPVIAQHLELRAFLLNPAATYTLAFNLGVQSQQTMGFGCFLFLPPMGSLSLATVQADAAGSWYLPIWIPREPALLGLPLFGQLVAPDSGNPSGYQVSNLLILVIGAQ